MWCTGLTGGTRVSGAGTDADCALTGSQITGLRFVRTGDFLPADKFVVNIWMTPVGNAAGDVYENRTGGRADGVLQSVGPAIRRVEVIASSIGDYVWLDRNRNGIQDDGETGVVGFPVALSGTDLDGNVVNRSTFTFADGSYVFSGLASGTYTVTFGPNGLTGGRTFTAQSQGDDPALDSDGDVVTGSTGPLTLAPSTDRRDIDQGIITALTSLQVRKSVVDPTPGATRAQEFPVTVSCLRPGATEPTIDTISITAAGTPVTVPGVWPGSSCTVIETGTDGATAVVSPSGAFTVAENQVVTVTVTNTYQPALTSVTVRKVVVDPTPAATRAASYPATLACTKPGAATADTYPLTLSADGTPVTVTGLYVGSSCTVTETDTHGATATVSPAGPFTLAQNQVVTVTVTNTYQPALTSVTVRKVVVDPTPAATRAASYPATLACTKPGAEAADTYPLTLAADGTPVTVTGLYVGSSCTVTETDTHGATATVSPAGAFTLAQNQVVTVTVTNTYQPALTSVSLSKRIVDPDPTDAKGDAASFAVQLRCTAPGASTAVVTPVTLLRDGTPVVVPGIPVGSSCTVSETDTDGGVSSVAPAGAFIAMEGTTVTVVVTNTFPAGESGQLPSPPLAKTGSNDRGALQLGLLLLAVGVVVLALGRRRA